MTKWIGNKIGSEIQATTTKSGIFSIFDQYYFRKIPAGWPAVISATGGDYITTPGNGYKYHTFLNSGTFTMTTPPGSANTIDVVVQGGGAGCGADAALSFPSSTDVAGGGGGGAGGAVYYTSYPIPGGTVSIPITVGLYGAAQTSGSNTTFTNPIDPTISLTAYGGGKGGNAAGNGAPEANSPGTPGGCGGGGGGYKVPFAPPAVPYLGGTTTQVPSMPTPLKPLGYGASGGNGGDHAGGAGGSTGLTLPQFAFPLTGESALIPGQPPTYGSIFGAGGASGGSAQPNINYQRGDGGSSNPGIFSLPGQGASPPGVYQRGGSGVVIIRYNSAPQ